MVCWEELIIKQLLLIVYTVVCIFSRSQDCSIALMTALPCLVKALNPSTGCSYLDFPLALGRLLLLWKRSSVFDSFTTLDGMVLLDLHVHLSKGWKKKRVAEMQSNGSAH